MTFSEPIIVRHFSHNFDLFAVISLWFLKSPNVNRVKIVRDESIETTEENIPTMEDLIKGTVEPFARFSGIEGDIIEMSQHKRQHYQNG